MVLKVIQKKWVKDLFWKNFMITIGGLGTFSFLYHVRKGATTNLDAADSGNYEKFE